jgi:hypothetical protein
LLTSKGVVQEGGEAVTTHEVVFDSADVNELARRFTLPELRRMLDKAEIDAAVDAFFEGTPYADAKPFPNGDYAEACRLALDIAIAQRPKPKPIPGRVHIDVDEIKRRSDLAGHIGQFTRLRKSGQRFTGRCPIHGDKNPSLVVYPDQSWHCFGCGKGGDIFSFIMAKDGVDFRQAAESLR